MSQPIPQGIEVLVLKATVDPDFKQLLLQQRTAAAAAIGLELTAAEATMLAAVPAAQLEAIIARTSVPQEHRRAFLGQAAAAMLAAVGAISSAVATAQMQALGGARGPFPPNGKTDAPPRPKGKPVEERVIEVISKRTGVEVKQIKRDNTLVKDLALKADDLENLRKDLEKEFGIDVPEALKNLGTVGETIDYVAKALKDRTVEERIIAIISKRTGVEAKQINRGNTLARDLKAKAADLEEMRTELETEFDIDIPVADFKKLHFVASVITYVEKALKSKKPRSSSNFPGGCGGIRADRPR